MPVCDPGAAVPHGLGARCPPRETPLRWPDGELPQGADAVRICAGLGGLTPVEEEMLSVEYDVPGELLRTGVDEFTDAVNDLPEMDPEAGCTLQAGPVYVFYFLYPDDDARAVQYDSGGCGTLNLSPTDTRRGGSQVKAMFDAGLDAQRS